MGSHIYNQDAEDKRKEKFDKLVDEVTLKARYVGANDFAMWLAREKIISWKTAEELFDKFIVAQHKKPKE